MLTPSLKGFLKAKEPVPIYIKTALKAPDPLEAYRKLCGQPPTALLESGKGLERVSRYSFTGIEPFLILEAKGNQIRLTEEQHCITLEENPIKILSDLMSRFYIPKPPELPPFFGGAMGLFSYDLAHVFECLPRTAVDDLHLPDLYLAFFEKVLVMDHVERAVYLIFCPNAERFHQSDRERLYHDARDFLLKMESRLLGRCLTSPSTLSRVQPMEPIPKANMTREEYLARVKRCQVYIAQGDIFQANLSLRFCTPLQSCSPVGLYSLLREVNPSPFAAFLDLGRAQIISSSPERLVRVAGKIIETRPIAGTRPRGKNTLEDDWMKEDLLTNTKERAEHLMLVDLERNDLGRVARYGSIKVDELMVTERYSHVMHIVSNIQGRLRNGVNCLDALRAVFPGGTITGVPKIRCMEIIDELEPVTRGPYTGSIGYISFSGDMDLNILIRSFVTTRQMAYFQVGAGIVADSDPEREYQECLYKGEALFKTLRMAQGKP